MTVESPIFAPAIGLVLWSLFMLAWLALTRLPAMAKAGISLGTVVGARGVNLEGVIADRVNWKSHNYTHLMEQPTLFYATVVILGVIGQGDGLNLQLAWAYVFELKKCGADVKWVKTAGIHLTLKFLGNVRMGLIPVIEQRARPIFAAQQPVRVQVRGLGAFPSLGMAPRDLGGSPSFR